MKRWHTREDSGIRLDRQLRWWHDDEPIEHPRIVELFNQGVRPTDDGRFKLEVGNDWCFIAVEDAAYAVVALDELEGRLWVRLSDRTGELLEPQTLSLDADGVVIARVKQGRARARFSRDAQFALGERLTPHPGGVSLAAGASTVEVPGLAALFG